MKSAAKAKPAAKKKAAPAVRKPVRKPRAAAEPLAPVRQALVRDSFTMPADEYAVLARVKAACLKSGIDIKKAELLRVAFALLDNASQTQIRRCFAALPQLKTGRPPKA
ncbi:hypothetical protein [Massilia sp. TS11]|uniref:hypothetical protein n=1 Tax=Massilia sp. TS11 TaxID=2908003 RepID=UPI001EDABE0A|nr:hypothetical protein [Massilia sp. TS11]MCG2584281.1 hypothetical protein [Massilia sp. TS11]